MLPTLSASFPGFLAASQVPGGPAPFNPAFPSPPHPWLPGSPPTHQPSATLRPRQGGTGTAGPTPQGPPHFGSPSSKSIFLDAWDQQRPDCHLAGALNHPDASRGSGPHTYAASPGESLVNRVPPTGQQGITSGNHMKLGCTDSDAMLILHSSGLFIQTNVKVLAIQLCLTLCDPMDCSPPGSSVHGILQARIQEWVAIPFSRGSSLPRDQTQVSRLAGGFFMV